MIATVQTAAAVGRNNIYLSQQKHLSISTLKIDVMCVANTVSEEEEEETAIKRDPFSRNFKFVLVLFFCCGQIKGKRTGNSY